MVPFFIGNKQVIDVGVYRLSEQNFFYIRDTEAAEVAYHPTIRSRDTFGEKG